MNIVSKGILYTGTAGTPRAVASFPTVTSLGGTRLLATFRVGTGKDSEDEQVECCASDDGGATWSEPWRPFGNVVDGVVGSLKVVYVTRLSGGALFATTMWVDRTSFAGKPLFNEETQGCLPARILVAESVDQGTTWSQWRPVETPARLGPPSLTSPALLFPSGRIAISVESNKHYLDTSPWLQRVEYICSADGGKSWPESQLVCADSGGRLFHWDQRAGVTPDGRIVTFTWLYDSVAGKYLEIERRISSDEGRTWSAPEPLGISDQPSRPAIFPDGRLVLAWVDRYGSQSIRARAARSAEGRLEQEVTLYDAAGPAAAYRDTGELLVDMGAWTYGLPYAEALPDGDAMVVWYGGNPASTSIHWARLRAE
ncbi:MAG: sialidase family protein [Bryobacteraceae bacterium]